MGNEKVRVEVEMPKELFNLLREFCEWAGNDVRDFIEATIIERIDADLDNLKGVRGLIPRVDEFFQRFSKFLEEV